MPLYELIKDLLHFCFQSCLMVILMAILAFVLFFGGLI